MMRKNQPQKRGMIWLYLMYTLLIISPKLVTLSPSPFHHEPFDGIKSDKKLSMFIILSLLPWGKIILLSRLPSYIPYWLYVEGNPSYIISMQSLVSHILYSLLNIYCRQALLHNIALAWNTKTHQRLVPSQTGNY